MAEDWLGSIRRAEKTAIMQNGKRKVHYKFPNGHEMAEEYSMETNVLLRRAWRKKTDIRRPSEWEVEVGDPEHQFNNVDSIGLKESSNCPYLVKRITKTSLEWRIRNLPYPPETYSVTADTNERCLVVRTTNKKYFKKIPIPELDRVGMLPDQSLVDFSHKFNTLIITYKKPEPVLQMEKKVIEELKNVKDLKDGDLDCNPS
ncbi:hypothetical protein LSTR_LSTR001233 [Laodelphax striatellus]|uniref:Protein DPCD n=1 Tax=Laodelphax striatellus TaxID=195883 RepID=A0A482XAQ5_LAOST|nr:hypothetical protein LSTR_LSTR001233 [Laodelphax striatellus]